MVDVSELTRPVPNAAELVIILNVEPGGNVSFRARLSSGWLGSCRYAVSILFSCVPDIVAYLFGSKVGYEASASIAPVLGLIATAAAGLPIAAKAVYAAA